MKKHVLLITAFLFTSCSSLRKEKEGDVLTQVDIIPSIEKALSSHLFVSGAWPARDWWTAFGDKQLSYIIEVALDENPDMKKVGYTARSALSHAEGVRSALFPSFSAYFQDFYAHLSKESLLRVPPSTLSAVINQVDVGLILTYEIDLWGKNSAKYKAALGEAYAKRAEAAYVQMALATAIASGYTHLHYLCQRYSVLEQAHDAISELKELILLRQACGLDSQFSVNAIEENLFEIQQTVAGLRAAIAIEEMNLKVCMGRSPDDPYTFKETALQPIDHFPLPNRLSIDLLARRADLMVSLWKVHAKSFGVKAAKAAFFPSVNLAAYGGLETLSWSSLFRADSLMGFLLPAINLPLFTGFKLTSELDKAHADFSEAVYEYNGLVLKAANEVTKAMTTLRKDDETLILQTKHVERKCSSELLEKSKFDAGVAQKIGYLEKRVAALEDTLTLLDMQEQYMQGIIALIKSLGGGYGSTNE